MVPVPIQMHEEPCGEGMTCRMFFVCATETRTRQTRVRAGGFQRVSKLCVGVRFYVFNNDINNTFLLLILLISLLLVVVMMIFCEGGEGVSDGVYRLRDSQMSQQKN